MPHPYLALTSEQKKELSGIAHQTVTQGKGILGANESTRSTGKHLQFTGTENTEKSTYMPAAILTAADCESCIG